MENYVLFMTDCKVVKIPAEAIKEFTRHDLHYIEVRGISTPDGHITYSITEDQRRKHITNLGIITRVIIEHRLIYLYELFKYDYSLSTINLSADVLFIKVFNSIISAIRYLKCEDSRIIPPRYLWLYIMTIADAMIPYYEFNREHYLKKASEIEDECKLDIGVHVGILDDDPKNILNREENRELHSIKRITNRIIYNAYYDSFSGDIVITMTAESRNMFMENLQTLIGIAKDQNRIGQCGYKLCHHAGIITSPSLFLGAGGIGISPLFRLLFRINSAIYFLDNLDMQFVTCTPLVPAVYDEMLIFAAEYYKTVPSEHSRSLESVKAAMRKLYDTYEDIDAVDMMQYY